MFKQTRTFTNTQSGLSKETARSHFSQCLSKPLSPPHSLSFHSARAKNKPRNWKKIKLQSGRLFNISFCCLSNIFTAFGPVWLEWKFPPRDSPPTSSERRPTTLTTRVWSSLRSVRTSAARHAALQQRDHIWQRHKTVTHSLGLQLSAHTDCFQCTIMLNATYYVTTMIKSLRGLVVPQTRRSWDVHRPDLTTSNMRITLLQRLLSLSMCTTKCDVWRQAVPTVHHDTFLHYSLHSAASKSHRMREGGDETHTF